MRKVATTFTCATLIWASPVWADESSAENVASTASTAEVAAASTPEVAAAKSSSTAEAPLENAAVDRAFAGSDLPRPDVPVRPHRFGVYFGIRAMNLKHSGYDPYSDSDAFVQHAVGFSFSPVRTRPLSLHFLAEWNLGASSAYARGAQTDLLVNRIALGVEARWMPKSRFYLYAKVVPAAVNLYATIDDYALGATLESSAWTYMIDTSGGAALRLGTAGKEPGRTASFWLMMDWGYTFAGQTSMTFRPKEIEDDTRKFGAINLPSFQPSGFITRASFGVTF